MSAEAGYVTPNVNVVYGFGFLDLAQEPIILTTPDSEGRYYLVEILDMWDIAFAYGAGKEVGYKGGKFALVGPGWKGELPPGVKRIDAPTRWVVIQHRVYVKDEADLSAAETGALAWRFYTAPGDPSKPFENEVMEMAAKTWHGEWWKMGGGGPVLVASCVSFVSIRCSVICRTVSGAARQTPSASRRRAGGDLSPVRPAVERSDRRGSVGMRAICRFDPDQGVGFATYATWWVTVSLQSYVQKNSLRAFGRARVGDNHRRSDDVGRRRAPGPEAMSIALCLV
jgi:hypothetical protein